MNNKCQVFTPLESVIELLNIIGYKEGLFGKKIIENACGDGSILCEVVKRYILDCRKNGLSDNEIKKGLESDVYGAEIDEKHYRQCVINLDGVAAKYDLYGVRWNLLNVDILSTNLEMNFDFVVGNPPYITYRDLDGKTRDYLKAHYEVCAHGKFDYCYAFIEASIKSLNQNGKMSYLVPSSIFKNVFAQKLRDYMKPHILKVLDYGKNKIFENVLTSSAIILIHKNNYNKHFEYINIPENKSIMVNKDNLGKKWMFNQITEELDKTYKFGDYFKASISIATLLNEVFVLNKFEDINENFVKYKEFEIEKGVLKKAVSPRNLHFNKKEYIIFPYYYEGSKLHRYSEDQFERLFPKTTLYLRSKLDELNKRKSDKKTLWFEYGRSQALSQIYQEKLLTSTVVTSAVKVYDISKSDIPYSGIFIVSKRGLPLSIAKRILESPNFYRYVQSIGINANGSSLRITPADINNYRFSKEEVILSENYEF